MKQSPDLEIWSVDRTLYIENFYGETWLPQGQLWPLTRRMRHSPNAQFITITTQFHFQPKGHQEPRKMVELSQSLAECINGKSLL